MDELSSESPTSNTGWLKTTLNLLVAIPFVLLALWVLIADLLYPGNLLFQDSVSMMVMGLFLMLISFGLVVLAILPKRVIIAANLLLLMRVGMGWPLSLFVDHSLACRIVSFCLFVFCAYYLVSALRLAGLKLHLRPWVRWKHSLLTVFLSVAVAIIGVLIILFGYLEAGKSIMGSYVQFSWSGISLVERVLVKEGHQVHLIGMMHVGDGSFYKELNKRMYTAPEQGRRLVLTEGVSDSQNLLPADFKSGELYANFANALGLEPQNEPISPEQEQAERKEDFDVPGVTFRNADIDVSELDEEHVERLVSMLTFFASLGTPESLTAAPEGVSGQDMEELFFEVLLGQRNDVLMEHFEKSGSSFSEVFIPWGAAHLPDIEERLLEQGYTEELEVVRPVVEFWK